MRIFRVVQYSSINTIVLALRWTVSYYFKARIRRKLKNLYLGSTIVCIGNGPSLSKEQLQIARRFPLIATNRAHQTIPQELFHKGGKGWIIINDDSRCFDVLPDLPDEFKNVVFSTYHPRSFLKVIRLWRPRWIFAPAAWSIRFRPSGVQLAPCHQQEFSEDFSKRYFPGKSVIFSAIQLAYYMGAKRIILIGCDMSYSGSAVYSELIRPGRLGIQHQGSFDYSRDARKHMIVCHKALAENGVELLNATPDGAINELPRITNIDFKSIANEESPVLFS